MLANQRGWRRPARSEDERREAQYSALWAVAHKFRGKLVELLKPAPATAEWTGKLTVLSARGAHTVYQLIKRGGCQTYSRLGEWVAGTETDECGGDLDDQWASASQYIVLQLTAGLLPGPVTAVQVLDDMMLFGRKLPRLVHLVKQCLPKEVVVTGRPAVDFVQEAINDVGGSRKETLLNKLRELRETTSEGVDDERALAAITEFLAENPDVWNNAWAACSETHKQIDLCGAKSLIPLTSRSAISEPVRITGDALDDFMRDPGWDCVDITRSFVAGHEYRNYRLLPVGEFAETCRTALEDVSPGLGQCVAWCDINMPIAYRGIDDAPDNEDDGQLIYHAAFSPTVRLLPIATASIKEWLATALGIVPHPHPEVRKEQLSEGYALLSFILSQAIQGCLRSYASEHHRIDICDDNEFASHLLGALAGRLDVCKQALGDTRMEVKPGMEASTWQAPGIAEVLDLAQDRPKLAAIGDQTGNVPVYEAMLGPEDKQRELQLFLGLLKPEKQSSRWVYTLFHTPPDIGDGQVIESLDKRLTEGCQWLHLAVLEMGGFAVPDSEVDDDGSREYMGEVDLRGETVSTTRKALFGRYASQPETVYGDW